MSIIIDDVLEWSPKLALHSMKAWHGIHTVVTPL
ncbi:hypothetical protein LINPERHAP2_LOCUS19710 [Linum perenne]